VVGDLYHSDGGVRPTDEFGDQPTTTCRWYAADHSGWAKRVLIAIAT
jgi:hypothetical protein